MIERIAIIDLQRPGVTVSVAKLNRYDVRARFKSGRHMEPEIRGAASKIRKYQGAIIRINPVASIYPKNFA